MSDLIEHLNQRVYSHDIERLEDIDARHPAEMLEPEGEDEGERHAAQLEAIQKLVEFVVGHGRIGGQLYQRVQTMAVRFSVLTWIIRPQLLGEGVSLSDIADCLGCSRAYVSKIHVTLNAIVGVAGPGAKTPAGREKYRAARVRSLAAGNWEYSPQGTGQGLDRDARDAGLAEAGLRLLCAGHRADWRKTKPGSESADLTHPQRHALKRRGWIDQSDMLTPAGREAAREAKLIPA